MAGWDSGTKPDSNKTASKQAAVEVDPPSATNLPTNTDRKNNYHQVTRKLHQTQVDVIVETLNGESRTIVIDVGREDDVEAVRAKVLQCKADAAQIVKQELEKQIVKSELVSKIIFAVGFLVFPAWLVACWALCRPNMSKCALAMNVASTILGVVSTTVLIMVVWLLLATT